MSSASHPRNGYRQTEHESGGWWRWVLVALVIAAGVTAAYFWWTNRGDESQSSRGSGGGESGESKRAIRVKVVRPHRGGLTRTTTQPGTVHAFQYADLFAKASGYLRAQVVDIGDTVEKGQVLAEVYNPERLEEVQFASAEVEQARARVRQAEAALKAAEAEVRVAEAVVAERKAEVGQYTAARVYREKQYVRYVQLAQDRAIDQRVADEQQQDFESARSAEQVALTAVRTAEARLERALAQVVSARADIEAARAGRRVAESRLSRVTILAEYTRLKSPYDGVVTARNYHDGDFIRDADRGESPPVLSVARTDLMRVIVYVPDRDVVYLDRDDPAVVRIDALGGEEFHGKVARYSEVEMSDDRTMRTEVDLPNPTGRLKQGMYGNVSILLQPASANLTIPSQALHRSEHGSGTVFVADVGRAREKTVRVAADDGLRAEVLSGLRPDDEVIVSYVGTVEDGEPIIAEPATVGEARRQAAEGRR
ncbi:MAG TPA: efflux RND transporter periplasmic adaptor subunit [Isosphaeraceae bacterium]|nr:efflux RND transporter periplasmic adaptor subunit [Isosphaeraceae bacterium]